MLKTHFTITLSKLVLFLLLLVGGFGNESQSIFAYSAQIQSVAKDELLEKLKKLEGVEVVKTLSPIGHYKECYEIRITQSLDHFNPNSTKFKQRIFVSHVDFSKPVTIITEGYTAKSNYTSEISSILESNQIVVEHRFFGESCPTTLDWNFMNVRQAAADMHQIVELFKTIYKGKWVNSGISKGGQTTIYHRCLYPKDVDVSVPYVAPLVFLKEDPRPYEFFKHVGTEDTRKKLKDFQRMVLKNRAKLLPVFQETAKEKGFTFNRLGVEKAYEYSVFEYEFSFWQWGHTRIPAETDDAKDIVEDLMSAAEFFSDGELEEWKPFFYQALTEVGFYAYDISDFKDLVKVATQPSFDFYGSLFNTSGKLPAYNPQTMQDVYYWLQDYGNNILYIYGENDAWSACAVPLTGRTNALKMVKKGGSHTTRIKTFQGEELERIYSTLEKWLDVKIKRN